jgi:DNA gyrase subunit A
MMGQSIRFKESDVRAMGRSARGVRGIRLREGDRVIGMNVAAPDTFIFVISESGYGKRTKIDQFTPHRRGGVGIKAAVVNKKTGNLVGVRSLREGTDEVIVISKLGQVIRLSLNDISALGRATQGVRIMRLDAKDSVASVGLVQQPPTDGDEEDEDKKDSKPKTKAKPKTTKKK